MIVKKIVTAISVLGTTQTTLCGVIVMDQIGPDDGSMVGTNLTGCQNFEATYDIYDIAAMDNFAGYAENIHSVEMVLSGWNGFVDPSSVAGYTANLYSDPYEASIDLTGDIATSFADAADCTLSESWNGFGYLISMPSQMITASGTNWIAMIPQNDFATGGQTGVADTLGGDGVFGWQANPGGGFGLPGNMQEIDSITGELAYRLNAGGDPCEYPLPENCPADVDGDLSITVTDVLAILGSWGECGDGTFRPAGDVAPLPNGDCCVNVSDVLAVVGAWGEDCNIYGGCCHEDGSCTPLTEIACEESNGYYFGDNTTCTDGTCTTGACCIDSNTCNIRTSYSCTDLDGLYQGDGSICEKVDCIIDGDECEYAFTAVEGANPFDTTSMSPSQPQPDESQCENTDLDWENSPDAWFVWVADQTRLFSFNTCDTSSFDTSIVLYENTCTNQVACNGDGDGISGCQAYYSEIDYECIAGNTYYIRIGGWQGQTGTGTLNIHIIPPPPSGACCFPNQFCLDGITAPLCDAYDGFFAGDGTVCEKNDPCDFDNPFQDECEDAGPAVVGQNTFSTILKTASQPQPDESQCEDTFLNWGNSPDGWFAYTAEVSAVHHFTTCDATSYDTSIVLYEDSCDNQVACNGDGTGDSGCQTYYSAFDYYCTAGTTYYIRIGGFNAATGIGTLTISFNEPTEPAACCYPDGSCVDYNSDDCWVSGGTWVQGESCSTYACPEPACPGGQVNQNVHGVDDAWSAAVSAIDGATDFMRADLVNVPSMGDFTFWGLQLFYNGSWVACTGGDDYGFNVRTYDDAGGAPGAMSSEALDSPAVKYATGDLYAGIYESFRFDMNHSASNVGWIGVQSASDGVECWFLWMSSGVGDGYSALSTDGGPWDVSTFVDLALCID